jgi:two-component system, chemotaxis family, chemotaxis protein CheY
MSIRILVADDDPLMRVFATVALADIADPLEAADGFEALQKLREEHFDLALLDWDMPGPSGVDILKTLRAEGCRTPIIMVTAKNERVDVLRAIHAGASDYVVKPFEPDVLRQKATKWLAAKLKKPHAEKQLSHADKV